MGCCYKLYINTPIFLKKALCLNYILVKTKGLYMSLFYKFNNFSISDCILSETQVASEILAPIVEI